jgi:hypothetical protein
MSKPEGEIHTIETTGAPHTGNLLSFELLMTIHEVLYAISLNLFLQLLPTWQTGQLPQMTKLHFHWIVGQPNSHEVVHDSPPYERIQ